MQGKQGRIYGLGQHVYVSEPILVLISSDHLLIAHHDLRNSFALARNQRLLRHHNGTKMLSNATPAQLLALLLLPATVAGKYTLREVGGRNTLVSAAIRAHEIVHGNQSIFENSSSQAVSSEALIF